MKKSGNRKEAQRKRILSLVLVLTLLIQAMYSGGGPIIPLFGADDSFTVSDEATPTSLAAPVVPQNLGIAPKMDAANTVLIGNATITATLGFYENETLQSYSLDDGVKSAKSFLMGKYFILKLLILGNGNQDQPTFAAGSIKVWLPDVLGGTPSLNEANGSFSYPIKDGTTGRYYITNLVPVNTGTTVNYPMIYTLSNVQNLAGYEESLTVEVPEIKIKAEVTINHDGEEYQLETTDKINYKFTRTRTSYSIYKGYYSYSDNSQINYNYSNITWPGDGSMTEDEYKTKYYWGEWFYYLSSKSEYNYTYATEGVMTDTMPYNGEVAQIRGVTNSGATVLLWDVNEGWLPNDAIAPSRDESEFEGYLQDYIKANFKFDTLDITEDNKTITTTYSNLEKLSGTLSYGTQLTVLVRFEKTGYDTLRPNNKSATNSAYLDATYSYLDANGNNVTTRLLSSSSAQIREINNKKTHTVTLGKTAANYKYYETDLAEAAQDFVFYIRPYNTLVVGSATVNSVAKEDAVDIVVEDNLMQGKQKTGTYVRNLDGNDYVFTKVDLFNFNSTVDTTDYDLYVRYAGDTEYTLFRQGTLAPKGYSTVTETVDLTGGIDVIGVKAVFKGIYNNFSSSSTYMYFNLYGKLKQSDIYANDKENIYYVNNSASYSVYEDYDNDNADVGLVKAQTTTCTLTVYDKTYGAHVYPDGDHYYYTNPQGKDITKWSVKVQTTPNSYEGWVNLKNFTVVDILPAGTRITNQDYSTPDSTNANAAIKITKGGEYLDYVYPDIESVSVEQLTDANGIVRDKIIVKFSSSANKQAMYKDKMAYTITYDTYINKPDVLKKQSAVNYTAVVLNDSDAREGYDFQYYYYYQSLSGESSSNTWLSSTYGPTNTYTSAANTLANAIKDNGKWGSQEKDTLGSYLWRDADGNENENEYVAFSYAYAVISEDIRISEVIDNSAYPIYSSSNPNGYKPATGSDFLYDADSDLYRGRWKITLTQSISYYPIMARDFTFVNILPKGVMLADGEASVAIAGKGVSGYAMPDYKLIVEDNYKGSGRQRIMVIFTSDGNNPLQMFYKGMSYDIYLDTVLTEFEGSSSNKTVSNMVAVLYKDFNYGQRGGYKANATDVYYSNGSNGLVTEANVKFGETSALFSNVDELNSAVYNDNGTNDTAKYTTKAATIIRFTEATDYINIEYVKTDIFSTFKKGHSQANFASEAELMMTVLGSGADTTKIVLYNFLPSEGDAFESSYDWLLKGINLSGAVADTAKIYYTTSEEVINIAEKEDVLPYTLTNNPETWQVYDPDMSNGDKAKITGIAIDFGDYILKNNESLNTTFTIKMPAIYVDLIGTKAYNRYYVESYSKISSELTYNKPVSSNTIGVELAAPKLTLGDTVFLDQNNDGIMDGSDKGINGISVDLYEIVNGQPIWRGATSTNADGKYSFTIAQEGDYRLKFSVPSKLTDIPPKFSDHVFSFEETRRSVYKKNIVASNGFTETITFAYKDFEGMERCEYLNASAGVTAIYALILGDTVFLDENNNGILDDGEYGRGGIAVELYKKDGISPVQTATTSDEGKYYFIVNDGGTYYVKILNPDGAVYQFYFNKLGEPEDDNSQWNNIGMNGKSDEITFDTATATVNKQNMENYFLDAALIPKIIMKIGGTVFLDSNRDGIMDSDEIALSDIPVKLYRPARASDDAEVIVSINGKHLVAIQTVTTDTNGKYSLSAVEEDDYYVWVDSTAIYDYGSIQHTSSSQTVNTLGGDGLSEAVVFAYVSGQMVYEKTGVDGGLVGALGNLRITKIETGTEFSNDPVYLSGAVFKLVDENNNTVAEAETISNGQAIFEYVPIGSYTLVETSAPDGYSIKNANTPIIIRKNSMIALSIENSRICIVSYDGNGNTGGQAPVDGKTYVVGDTVTVLDEKELVREGFKFIGWNTKPDGEEVTYAVGESFTIEDNTTLYAQWEPLTYYAVVYDGNGNTGGNDPVDGNKYLLNDEVTVSDREDLYKNGYSFVCWNTKADGSGTDYAEDEIFNITGDTILYAKWQKINYYSVVYVGNGNTDGSAPADHNLYLYGNEVEVLGMNSLARDGYIFTGWNTGVDGKGTGYAADATFVITENTILYAQWIKSPIDTRETTESTTRATIVVTTEEDTEATTETTTSATTNVTTSVTSEATTGVTTQTTIGATTQTTTETSTETTTETTTEATTETTTLPTVPQGIAIMPPSFTPSPDAPVINGRIVQPSPDNSDVFYVFDEDGTPLGYVRVPEGKTIEDMDIFDDLIPFGSIEVGVKGNPKTSDRFNGDIFVGLILLGGLLAYNIYLRKKKAA